MAGVYSTRFILHTGGGVTLTYVVPNGKVAVIKSVSAYNGSGSAANFSLLLKGTGIWVASVPGGGGGFATNLMIVAYAGESIGMFFAGTPAGAQASGYLLDQLPGRSAAALEVVAEDPPPPLPSAPSS